MRLNILAVGKRMPDWVEIAVQEYSKRFPPLIQFKLIEIAAATRSKNSQTEQHRQKEQENIETALTKNSIIVVLDERGENISSQSLAAHLQIWIDEQKDISLVIGGTDGLSDEIKSKAHQIWSLSKMTLPHGLVRVMLVEQLYRAWSITQNHPYHRE